ncbi:MAG: SDR family oxidoreductase [Rhodospirillaceae bacterium]|nr:SDR family oxidoreductase [Rhodospirillaceae bacterium]MBT5242867.1 SDR family oxidoreductase [Rhodospirillaceae bacterium]MBT5563091.1 SDR family oxidoreductase [Rhodospirillaceae bacterium]MBT6243406.1 SDR family oxidoreductase [Rhodospirillaceae bacterium]
MSKKLSVLVTGGAGYLGSILVPEFLGKGFHVTVLDNFMFRQNSLATSCVNPNFNVVNGDARNETLLKELLAKADVVIPLAALVGAPICAQDPIGATTTNLDGQMMLLKNLSPDQRVLIPITNSGYGIGEAGKFCTEKSPLRPISLYGQHKVQVEAEALSRDNTVSFRLATVFGMAPRMRIDLLVNDFTYRAVNDRAVVLFESHFKRNFIHVRDVTRAFLHALENFEAMKGEPYNVGLSEANLSKWELCETIQIHLPNFVPIEAPIGEDPDKRDYIVSNDKIEATGYKPAFSLEDGIRDLIKGYTMIKNSVYGNV